MPPNRDLDALRVGLLRDLGVRLRPDQGDEAFERHQLLAVRFNRAARLNRRKADTRDGAIWRRYFDEHLPRAAPHADLLWHEWRVPLLKDEAPGARVAISHGQPQMHWRATTHGLFLNLESLWDDYVESVEHFVALLSADAARRRVALERWRKRQSSVQMVSAPTSLPFALPQPLAYSTASASVSSNPSTIKPGQGPNEVGG